MAAKKKKKASGGGGDTPIDKKVTKDEPAAPKKPSRTGVRALAALVALAIGGGVFVTWHRQRDPARIWARRLEDNHRTLLEARLTRCFDGADAPAVRRLIAPVRAGSFSGSFARCRGPAMTETVVAPMAFAASIGEPPGNAVSAKVHERDRLERLRLSLDTLQRVTDTVTHDGPIPDADRERIATALEDVAVDVDSERTGLNELIRAAVNDASVW